MMIAICKGPSQRSPRVLWPNYCNHINIVSDQKTASYVAARYTVAAADQVDLDGGQLDQVDVATDLDGDSAQVGGRMREKVREWTTARLMPSYSFAPDAGSD